MKKALEGRDILVLLFEHFEAHVDQGQGHGLEGGLQDVDLINARSIDNANPQEQRL